MELRRALAVLLAALAALCSVSSVSHASAPIAAATAHGYDVSAIARVDVHEVGGAEVSSAQLRARQRRPPRLPSGLQARLRPHPSLSLPQTHLRRTGSYVVSPMRTTSSRTQRCATYLATADRRRRRFV